MTRCDRCVGDELYEQYHDTERGVPVYDDRKLFEFLVLESAQAGLSWITVLRKREGYREAFAEFDIQTVAEFTESDVESLLQNPQIIRHRGKIQSTIVNAQVFLEIQQEYGSFSSYIWGFTDNKIIALSRHELADCPSSTPLAEAISKDLKKRGMKFVGPTIIYAYLQAIGVVNDHIMSCFRREEVMTTLRMSNT